MARAIWNGRVIAESDQTVRLEGDLYFPESSLKREFFRISTSTSNSPRFGLARYLSVEVDGMENLDAARYYPDPMPLARKVRGMIAFGRGIEIDA